MLLMCNIHKILHNIKIPSFFQRSFFRLCIHLVLSEPLRAHLSTYYGELPVLPAPSSRGLCSHVTVLSEEPSYSAQEEADRLLLLPHLS